MKKSFLLKVIIAIIGSSAFALTFIFLPVWVTTMLATLVSVLIFYELSVSASLVNNAFFRVVGFAVSFTIPWMMYFKLNAIWIAVLIFSSLIAAFVYLIITGNNNSLNELICLVFCESVFQISISFMTILRRESAIIVIIAYITAWGTDAIAQLVGRKIGKTHFVPEISPNKTLEGSFAGIIGNTAIISAFAIVLFLQNQEVPVVALILCGTLAGILGETGDLFFSYIKRYVGIKDFGTFIAGHGGALDRFDSVVFVLPLWCLFICFFSF